MYGPVLSVLLMGLLPVGGVSTADQAALERLTVAAPLQRTASAAVLSALPEHLSASGVLIVDLESGQVALSHNARRPRPIGSLTKLMTALVITENHALNETVTVPAGIEQTQGNVINLAPGEQYTVGTLLTALLVSSANDAAVTLAQFHAGSTEAFVEEMNERAKVLGLQHTSFADPAGLDHPGQWSTAQDLAWLASFVLRRPEIRQRMSLPQAEIRSLQGRSITLVHTHSLLRQGGPVVAGKTGTTDAAGQCLLSVVQGDGRDYLVILLGSRERYADMRAVLASLLPL